MNIQDQRLTCT